MLDTQLTFTKSGSISQRSVKLLAAQDLKWCAPHKQALPISDFWPNVRCCKVHSTKKSRKFRANNPEKCNNYIKHCLRGAGRYAESKNRAARNGHNWLLTRDEYNGLISRQCEYCQFVINERGIGLDRLDNSKHYSVDNVVPCCVECNVARHDLFTPDEMRRFVGPAIRAAKLARING